MGQKNSAPARRSDSSSRDNNQRSPNSGKRLQLSNLRVVSLEEYADRLNHKISDLYLCNNLIRSLPAELVIAAPNLETIDVSGNLLEEIPAELGELERLRQLVLFSNRIKVIPAPIFNALALTFLELSVRYTSPAIPTPSYI
jgi:Leucine-rich repeat (LRR) protein